MTTHLSIRCCLSTTGYQLEPTPLPQGPRDGHLPLSTFATSLAHIFSALARVGAMASFFFRTRKTLDPTTPVSGGWFGGLASRTSGGLLPILGTSPVSGACCNRLAPSVRRHADWKPRTRFTPFLQRPLIGSTPQRGGSLCRGPALDLVLLNWLTSRHGFASHCRFQAENFKFFLFLSL